MAGMGINGGDALGISVPSKNSGIDAWEELKPVISMLESSQFQFTLYDMYYGAKLDSEMLKKIRENIIG
jgi:hypothetical protein